MKKETIKRIIPQEVNDHLVIWVKLNRRWRAFHYIIGVPATVCAMTVASSPSIFNEIPNIFSAFAWISAVAIALMTFLVPLRRARGYVSAARILTNACNRYKLDPTYKLKKVLDALEEGENLIARGEEL